MRFWVNRINAVKIYLFRDFDLVFLVVTLENHVNRMIKSSYLQQSHKPIVMVYGFALNVFI